MVLNHLELGRRLAQNHTSGMTRYPDPKGKKEDAMGKYSDDAAKLLELVGGKGNIAR